MNDLAAADLKIVTELESSLERVRVTRFIRGSDERTEWSSNGKPSDHVTIRRRSRNEQLMLDVRRRMFTSYPLPPEYPKSGANDSGSQGVTFRLVGPHRRVTVPIRREVRLLRGTAYFFGRPASRIVIREQREANPAEGITSAESIEEGWFIDVPQLTVLHPDLFGAKRLSVLGSGLSGGETVVSHVGLKVWGVPADVRQLAKTPLGDRSYHHRIVGLEETPLPDDLFAAPAEFRQMESLSSADGSTLGSLRDFFQQIASLWRW